VAENMGSEQFAKAPPPGFDRAAYRIRGARAMPVQDGQRFCLGNLELIHTPGHSPDSMMLYDAERSLLFTGDSFYPATIYTHLDSGGGMVSDFSVYRRTMETLARRFAGVKTLRCSHNEPEVPGAKLQEAAAAFEAIAAGSAPFEADATGLRLHRFEGFSIVTIGSESDHNQKVPY
jgi:glyoxylase-like metal-dependent hydrolase (beta-lactamase superfamily II)